MLTILTLSILLGGLGLTIGLGVLFRGRAPLLLLTSFHLQVKEWFLYIVYLYINTSVIVDSLNHGFKDTELLGSSDIHYVGQYTLYRYLFRASDHRFFAKVSVCLIQLSVHCQTTDFLLWFWFAYSLMSAVSHSADTLLWFVSLPLCGGTLSPVPRYSSSPSTDQSTYNKRQSLH